MDDHLRTLRVGVTGHMDLDAETMHLVAEALRAHLIGLCATRPTGMVGVSCLAPGADRIFAHVLLDLGGRLEVIMPSDEYNADEYNTASADSDPDCGPLDPDCGPVLADLLRRAESVRAIDTPRARPQVYVAANDAMLDSIDSLIAVWNGVASAKLGGTAHVVDTARSRSIPVTVIWPEGATRRS